MTPIQLGRSHRDRAVSKEPKISLKNRYFETNPVLNPEQASAIARPGMKKWIDVGSGYIRKLYSAPGVFNDDLFVVSDLFLYRVTNLGGITLIGQISENLTDSVSMAATAPIGEEISENLFVASGDLLFVYTENGFAFSNLTATGLILDGDTVKIDSMYYRFTTGTLDVGTPDGTVGNPWRVNHPTGITQAFDNLRKAVNAIGEAGVDYSTLLTTAHPTIAGRQVTGNDFYVSALVSGAAGNGISLTVTVGANLAWGSPTTAGGGTPSFLQVLMPEDYGAVDVAHINSYVIVIPVQENELNGRFYWIEPGEIVVDALNFATAERSPDKIKQVVVFSDMFWLLGQNTAEPWVTSGDPAAPMQKFRGILYDRGTTEGAAIQVKDSLILADEDGAVFKVQGGLKRISTPDVEERIRKGIEKQLKGIA